MSAAPPALTSGATGPAAPGRWTRVRNALTPQEWARAGALTTAVVGLHVVGWGVLLGVVVPQQGHRTEHVLTERRRGAHHGHLGPELLVGSCRIALRRRAIRLQRLALGAFQLRGPVCRSAGPGGQAEVLAARHRHHGGQPGPRPG